MTAHFDLSLFDVLTLYIVIVTLLTLFVAVFMAQAQRRKKTVLLWLASGLVGVLLGASAALAAMHGLGYELVKNTPLPEGSNTDGATGTGGPTGGTMPAGMGAGGGPPGMSTMGGMMGGMGMGGMGMGGMGGGDPDAAPIRELTTLVGKIDLATGGLRLEVAGEQVAALAEALTGLSTAPQMNGEMARAGAERIRSVLTAEQLAVLDSFELPRPRGSFQGMGGRPPAGGAPQGGGNPGGGSGSGRPRRPGGAGEEAPAAAPPANPFNEEQNRKRLDSLLKRLQPDAAEASADS